MLSEYESNPNKGKRHKPPLNHPWRKFVTTEVAEFARDKSKQASVTTWKVGGGKPQK
jgi:hypothetical protein